MADTEDIKPAASGGMGPFPTKTGVFGSRGTADSQIPLPSAPAAPASQIPAAPAAPAAAAPATPATPAEEEAKRLASLERGRLLLLQMRPSEEQIAASRAADAERERAKKRAEEELARLETARYWASFETARVISVSSNDWGKMRFVLRLSSGKHLRVTGEDCRPWLEKSDFSTVRVGDVVQVTEDARHRVRGKTQRGGHTVQSVHFYVMYDVELAWEAAHSPSRTAKRKGLTGTEVCDFGGKQYLRVEHAEGISVQQENPGQIVFVKQLGENAKLYRHDPLAGGSCFIKRGRVWEVHNRPAPR